MSAKQWLLAILISLVLHASAAAWYLQQPVEAAAGAQNSGEDGLQVGLGSFGSYQDLMPKESKKPLVKTPVEEKIKPEKKPEPIKPKKAVVKATPIPLEKVVSDTPSPLTLALNTATETSEPIESTEKNKALSENDKALDDSDQKAMNKASGSSSDKSAGGKVGNAKSYFSQLMAWLNQYKTYPDELKKAKIQGVVHVKFNIDKQGNVLSSSIAKSSGHKELDEATLKMLADASPVPAFPDSFNKETLSLVIPVKYSLITNHYYKE